MAYICENLFNNEILLKSSSNGTIIKLDSIPQDLETPSKLLR